MRDPETLPREARERICIGFGEREGICHNIAGTRWTPLWCDECDEERRTSITESFERIRETFTKENPAT